MAEKEAALKQRATRASRVAIPIVGTRFSGQHAATN